MDLNKGRRAYTVHAGDILAVMMILAAAAASMVFIARAGAGEKGGLAVIEVGGEAVKRVTLAANQARRRFTVQGANGPSTVEVMNGRVRMVSSTCRDRICVGTGWVERPGSSIVCLPNRVVVRITGSRTSENVDTVTE